MRVEPVRLTREELYEQVWSEAMSKLAQRHGLSDVGLAKICRKLRIPLPWVLAEKEVGQPARRTLLPTVRATGSPALREAVLHPSPTGADGAEC